MRISDWSSDVCSYDLGYNYVSAHTDTGARIRLNYGTTAGHRPWFKALTAKLHGGYLTEGDSITIVFGDTSKGSPGMKLQTFCESGFEFKEIGRASCRARGCPYV